MDCIVFETPKGKCFVQPSHIVGVFANSDDENACYVSTTIGQVFHFKEKSDTVWNLLTGQVNEINEEKNRRATEEIGEMVRAMKTPRGDLN